LLALLGAHHFLHVSRIKVNEGFCLLACGAVLLAVLPNTSWENNDLKM
jgi:hypothetical protein